MTLDSTRLAPPTNYVFVDFENVHEIDFSVIGNKSVSFTLLLGAKHTRLDVKLVETMMQHAASVHLLRLSSSGKNALDFTLAFYLGQGASTDPTGYFHIVSRDKGFDPMIEHLRSRHINVRRHDDFSTLTFAFPAKTTSQPDELFTRVLEHLRNNKTNRPKRKNTLVRHLVGFAGNHGNEQCVLGVIDTLQKAGHISIGEKELVTYQL
ncbi:MAG: PIN domain-containing protein [Chthoniobacteraceae bacterium]